MAVIRSVGKRVDGNIDAKCYMHKVSTVPSTFGCETLLPVVCLLKFLLERE